MTKSEFEAVMRIPTCSQHEDMMQEFLLDWASKHGCSAKKDGKGNIYITKGKPPSGHYFPGFCNHVDTVHNDQIEMVKQRVYKELVWEGDKVTAVNPLLPKQNAFRPGWTAQQKKDDKKSEKKYRGFFGSAFSKDDIEDADIVSVDGEKEKPDGKAKADVEVLDPEEKKEEAPEMGRQTGLGMDDQGGCAIALAVIDSLPYAKAAFFVEEEIGMQGSKAADMHFFDDCAFVFSNDSPDRNRGTHYSSGVQLYSDEFFDEHLQKTCSDHGLTDFRSEPYTDIIQIRNHVLPDGKHIECLNFGNGGYDPHRDTEYARFSDVCAAEELLRALCAKIPLDRQYSSDIKQEARSWGGYGGYSYSYGGGYGGGGYRSGAWTEWARRQNANQQSDDDWWAGLGAKRPSVQAPSGGDFPGHSAFEPGSFSFVFKTPGMAGTAMLALRKLKRTTSERLEIEQTAANMVTCSGTLLALRYAYMACWNANNETKFAQWDLFLKKNPKAKAAFEKAVEFEDDNEDDGKMSHGPQDICSVTMYMAEDEAVALDEMLLGPLKDVDVQSDGTAYVAKGPLEKVKRVWACASAIQNAFAGRDKPAEVKPVEFKDLSQEDQNAFWDEVEFEDDGQEAPGDEETGDKFDGLEPDAPSADEPDDMDSFWDWFDSSGRPQD